jgi:membrane protein DedA with SNARE-associated domain
MHPIPFFAYSAVGTVVWTGFLVVSGYLLESHYERVAEWIDPFSKLVLAAIVASYLYRLVRQRRR